MRRRKVGKLDSLFALLLLSPLLSLVAELALNVVDSGEGVIDRKCFVGEVFAVCLLENVVVGGFVGLWRE